MSAEAERVAIQIDKRLVLPPLLCVLEPQANHGAQRLDVESCRLRFRVDLPHVVGERFLLFFSFSMRSTIDLSCPLAKLAVAAIALPFQR